eukprot:4017944-Alexandrium_andersonii.AAC.1
MAERPFALKEVALQSALAGIDSQEAPPGLGPPEVLESSTNSGGRSFRSSPALLSEERPVKG